MLTHVLQLLANGVMAGAILAVPAVGLTAIYAVLRFANFAIASHATVGAFAGYIANVVFGLPLIPSLVVAFLVAGLVGLVTDEIVLKPFRPHGFITTAIGSIALTIALENVVRFLFGNELRGYDLPLQRDWRVDGVRISPQQVENLAIAAVVMGVVFAFLAFTRTGKAMRAVADNPMLADIKGINALSIARYVSFAGMGLAGLGGMLIGLDTSIDPLTGFRSILSIFAAAVVGGLGSIPGAVLGALTVGIGEELCLLFLPPSYRSAVGFLAILLVLTIRPRGILGQRAVSQLTPPMINYIIAMAVQAGIYALMALGLNVIWGMAGMINLGLVGFFAVGAYVSALLTLKFGASILVGAVAGAAVAAVIGALASLVTARLRGDYLAIVTLGFAETIRLIATNEIWLTNGSDGLSGLPGPWRGIVSPQHFNLIFLGIVLAVVAVIYALLQRLSHSPFGRVLRAIRDDEQAVSVAGKNTIVFKVKAFALGSAVLGLAGALYGHYTSFIAPDIFVPLLTLYIILALLAGGIGSNRGAVLGAVVVVFLLESSRFVVPLVPGISLVQGAALREFVISVALIVMLRYRPQGLVPERRTHPVLRRLASEGISKPLDA